MADVKTCAANKLESSLQFSNANSEVVDFNVILTGSMGSGKSQTSSFFMKDKFYTEWSLMGVTTSSASCTKILNGKCIKLVDTPGFLNPCSLSHAEEFRKLAEVIIDMPNGINAVGLVINVGKRISREDVSLLENLLAMEEILAYTFIVFTHAKVLGNTDKKQQEKIEKIIRDPESCPEILQMVLTKVNNRYLLLECVDVMEPDYHSNKCHELITILQGIMDQNKKPFTCALNDIARQLQNFDSQNKGELVEALAKDLQTVNQELKRQQMKSNNDFWINFSFFAAGASAFVAGTFLSPTIIIHGASEMFKFLSKKSQILIDFAKAASKHF